MPAKSNSIAEQNLIVAGLGLQLGLISKEHIIRAFTEWMFDKSKSISDILIQQKALTEVQASLLNGAVAAHIQKEGNLEIALASLQMVKDLGSDLDHLNDNDLHQTLDSALVHRKELGLDEQFTKSSQVDQPSQYNPLPILGDEPETKDRFERQHFLDAGNLGEVYFAKDTELNRTVVAKYIKPEKSNDVLTQALFHLEGEVTGALDHPGIIPVYGLGKDSKGRLFYAMRFIRGRKLSRVISDYQAISKSEYGRKQEALIDLLQYFQSACLAIEYAHTKGVLHCDIKPDNIMIGDYGEVFVVDWGLVVVHGKAANPTVADEDEFATLEMGQIPPYRPSDTASSGLHKNQGGSRRGVGGTPAYMAPEQLRATFDDDISLIGPPADIYALGGTLFQILTGKPPHLSKKKSKETMEEFNRRILTGDFPRPRDLNSDISKPLEAIAIKALNLKPEERYLSARELAEDLKRWVADEPVKVAKESYFDRIRRWAKKNRTMVTSLSIAMLLVTGFSLIFAVITNQFARKLQISESRALESEKISIIAKHKAEESQDKAIEASSNLISFFDSGTPSKILKSTILSLAKPNTVREDMISAASLVAIPDKFFMDGEKKILDSSSSDAELQLHVKVAFAGVYRSRGLLPFAASKQMAILESFKNNDKFQSWEIGLAHREYAWTVQILGEYEKALQHYDKALEYLKNDKIVKQDKSSRPSRELGNLHLLRAYFFFEVLDYSKAIKELESAKTSTNDDEIQRIASGLKVFSEIYEKPINPAMIDLGIKAVDQIAPGTSKEIDFLTLINFLSNTKGSIFNFMKKDPAVLAKEIIKSFRKHLGEYNFMTLIAESQVGVFLFKHGKHKEAFEILDELIAKVQEREMLCSPCSETVLRPYLEFARDLSITERKEKAIQLIREVHKFAEKRYGRNSQQFLHFACFHYLSLLVLNKIPEAKNVHGEILENLASSDVILFPSTAIQVIKVMERTHPIDNGKSLLITQLNLFDKRTTQEFRTSTIFKVASRIQNLKTIAAQ